MAGAEGINGIKGAGKADSLWMRQDVKRKPIEEQAGGMSASFTPDGKNFLQAVQSAYSATNGTETVTHTNNI